MRSGIADGDIMWSSSSGRLWVPRLLGILTLSALPQESLECVFKRFLGDCTITDLPVFRYSEPDLEKVPEDSVPEDSVPENDTITVRKCKEPAVQNGISHTSGESMTFECNIGYFLIGSYFIQCKNSIWHPEVPSCKKIAPNLCGAPVIPSGKVEPLLPQYNTTNIIYLHCNANYSFPDETIEMKTTCHGYNVWQPPPQPCFIRTSHDTSTLHISNGKVSKGRKKFYEPGDNVSITCNPGYALNGPSDVRYIGGGKWSPELPDCSLNAFFILLITGMYIGGKHEDVDTNFYYLINVLIYTNYCIGDGSNDLPEMPFSVRFVQEGCRGILAFQHACEIGSMTNKEHKKPLC